MPPVFIIPRFQHLQHILTHFSVHLTAPFSFVKRHTAVNFVIFACQRALIWCFIFFIYLYFLMFSNVPKVLNSHKCGSYCSPFWARLQKKQSKRYIAYSDVVRITGFIFTILSIFYYYLKSFKTPLFKPFSALLTYFVIRIKLVQFSCKRVKNVYKNHYINAL